MYSIPTCLFHLSKVALYTRKIKVRHVQIVEANQSSLMIKAEVKKVEVGEVELKVKVRARKVKPLENNYSLNIMRVMSSHQSVYCI